MKNITFAALLCALMISCCRTAPEEAVVAKDEVVVENILARRSVRDFTDEPITQEQLDAIMECAVNAPSASNRQPWAVRVIRNPEMLDRIRAVNERAIFNAPVVVIVAGDKNSGSARFDCGLLTQNILLAAEAMDIGTCAVGGALNVLRSDDGKEIMEALDLPEDYELVIAICMGHKNERPEAKPRDASKVQYVD
ncbi:MAG: nitroreductase [Alistipes sp.]|nr:nitroreductase [Alistipes sp.]